MAWPLGIRFGVDEMNNATKISLISKTYTIDSVGNPVATPSEREVFAVKSSINQSEFYDAGQAGLKPYACFTVRLWDYQGEDELKENDKPYTIYRTYNRVDGRVELYATERKGVK